MLSVPKNIIKQDILIFKTKKKGKDDIEHHQLLSKGPHGGAGLYETPFVELK